MTTPSMVAEANRRLLRRLLYIALGMFGFGFAMVPLYNVLCEITGLNGKTNSRAETVAAGPVDATRTVTVEFVASVNELAPWNFAPQVTRMQVHPGEFYRTSFLAKNLTDVQLVGQAIPSVTPGPAALHFHKIECFCFSRQAFGPHESKDMPVVFRIDPDLAPEISTVTLSYTFFKVDEQGG